MFSGKDQRKYLELTEASPLFLKKSSSSQKYTV